MSSIFVSVLLFMVFMLLFVFYELEVNDNRILELYNDDQLQCVNAMANCLIDKQADGSSDDELVSIMPNIFEASGNCFAVLEKDDEIIFAKTVEGTEDLYENRYSQNYWNALNSEYDVTVISTSWNFNGSTYKVSTVTEVQSIYEKTGLSKHNYFIGISVAVTFMVIFSILITYVGVLNKTERDLKSVSLELKDKNNSIEHYMEDDKSEAKAEGHIRDEADFEKNYKSLNMLHDVSVLRNLLSKSVTDDLYPIQLIVIKFQFNNFYYPRDEIMLMADVIVRGLGKRELMCELNRGVFGIASYRCSEKWAKTRLETVISDLREADTDKKYRGFEGEIYRLDGSGDSVIENFEKIYANLMGDKA